MTPDSGGTNFGRFGELTNVTVSREQVDRARRTVAVRAPEDCAEMLDALGIGADVRVVVA